MSTLEKEQGFKSLGRSGAQFQGLETFPVSPNTVEVTMVSDEVTALCPVTGQPDFYVVKVTYIPEKVCLESKSLKLYLQGMRHAGEFCEDMASRMAQEIGEVLGCPSKVEITQKSRGGVSITAVGIWKPKAKEITFPEFLNGLLESQGGCGKPGCPVCSPTSEEGQPNPASTKTGDTSRVVKEQLDYPQEALQEAAETLARRQGPEFIEKTKALKTLGQALTENEASLNPPFPPEVRMALTGETHGVRKGPAVRVVTQEMVTGRVIDSSGSPNRD